MQKSNSTGESFTPALLAASLRTLYREPELSATRLLMRLGLHPEDPFFDERLDEFFEALKLWLPTRAGSIYVARTHFGVDISRQAGAPEVLFKIGMTRRAAHRPQKRVAQLNGAGVVNELLLIKTWSVHDAPGVERFLHESFAACRYKKEFFAPPTSESSEYLMTQCDALIDRCNRAISRLNEVNLTNTV